MQTLEIEVGENPPAVTVTALALMHLFDAANRDSGGPSFMTFTAIVMHLANPKGFPLRQMFAEVGLGGPSEVLQHFFDGHALKPDAQAAFALLSKPENAGSSELARFLAIAKEKFS